MAVSSIDRKGEDVEKKTLASSCKLATDGKPKAVDLQWVRETRT